MKLPRNVSGKNLIKALKRYQYTIDRQTGSHIRLTTTLGGMHHLTIPNHDPIKIGTLPAILSDIATHFGKSKEDIIAELFY